MTKTGVLIIGGGPAGLGAAWQLARFPDVDWRLYEREDQVGGLSRSICDTAGFTWDLGGHVCFSHYDVFEAILESALGTDGFYEHRREAWIRFAQSWVPYPFQNNLQRLPVDVGMKCLAGLIVAAMTQAAGTEHAPENFDEFIDATFGDGIAEAFMRPYNKKIWAHPLESMSYNWIGERVAVPDPALAAKSMAVGEGDDTWGPNSRFLFPKAGGTGAIWCGIGRMLPQSRVFLSREAVSIDRSSKTVAFADGSEVNYDRLITTAPLDVTASMIGDPNLILATSGLAHSSVNVVGVAVPQSVGKQLGMRCWMYFPQTDIPFYRVTHFSHYSPAHVPVDSGLASLLVEVSESSYRPVDQGRLVDSVIDGLVSSGLLDGREQVQHVWGHRVEHGYPIPTRARDDIVSRLLVELEADGIFSRGRFGGWRYEVGNMDHSFMQGYEAAARVLTGCAELTIWNPLLVNTPHPAMGWGRIG